MLGAWGWGQGGEPAKRSLGSSGDMGRGTEMPEKGPMHPCQGQRRTRYIWSRARNTGATSGFRISQPWHTLPAGYEDPFSRAALVPEQLGREGLLSWGWFNCLSFDWGGAAVPPPPGWWRVPGSDGRAPPRTRWPCVSGPSIRSLPKTFQYSCLSFLLEA